MAQSDRYLRCASFACHYGQAFCPNNNIYRGCFAQCLSRCSDGFNTLFARRHFCTSPDAPKDSETSETFSIHKLYASAKKPTAGKRKKGKRVGASHWLLLDPPPMELLTLGTGSVEPT